MKGILLAGGSGSRLYPLTLSLSKQLLPVADKPMIFYPLTTLILAGIREIGIVVAKESLEQFRRLLGDGTSLGIEIEYFTQESPLGLAHALHQTREFAHGESIMVILGDNLFYGPGAGESLSKFRSHAGGAQIFCKQVHNPQDFGVVEFDERGHIVRLTEKPTSFLSDWVATGLYVYDESVMERISHLSPSSRGELEISDLNNSYLSDSQLTAERLLRSTAWLDTGTIQGLRDASQFVEVIERQHGTKIGCPEEASWRQGRIDSHALLESSKKYMKSDYGRYLADLVGGIQR